MSLGNGFLDSTGWVGWRVGNMGMSLNPKTVTLYVDDSAISRVRVGPTGVLAF